MVRTPSKRRQQNEAFAVDAQLAELITRLARKLRRRSREQFEPLEMSDGQARALRTLGESEVPLRMSDLARRFDVTPRSATSVAEALEQRGLVTREIDPNDRRSILLRLTEAGHDLLGAISLRRAEVVAEIFAPLTANERASFAELCLKALGTTTDPTVRPPSGKREMQRRHRNRSQR